MTVNAVRSIVLSLIVGILVFVQLASAGGLDCGVCGMLIPDDSRQHFILKKSSDDAKPLHVCSLGCVRKAKKHDPSSKVEVSGFGNPTKFLAGESAFFLIKSDKVKVDLGDMVMPPFAVAFPSKKEADAARTKYGDGVVVQGIDAALESAR